LMVRTLRPARSASASWVRSAVRRWRFSRHPKAVGTARTRARVGRCIIWTRPRAYSPPRRLAPKQPLTRPTPPTRSAPIVALHRLTRVSASVGPAPIYVVGPLSSAWTCPRLPAIVVAERGELAGRLMPTRAQHHPPDAAPMVRFARPNETRGG